MSLVGFDVLVNKKGSEVGIENGRVGELKGEERRDIKEEVSD